MPGQVLREISVALVATEAAALWSSEQNVRLRSQLCRPSLFLETSWTQGKADPWRFSFSFHRCRCADSCANLSSTIASPIRRLV